jgi:hypothetical protein
MASSDAGEEAQGVPPGSSDGRLAIRFRTVNGSLYEIDYGANIWRRIERTAHSGELRAEGGELIMAAPLALGRSAGLLYLPFDGDVSRILVTSPVITIEPADDTKSDEGRSVSR